MLREQTSLPIGLAAQPPLPLTRCAQRIGELALIRNSRATARREPPALIVPTTRSPRSAEQAPSVTIAESNNATRFADLHIPENPTAEMHRFYQLGKRSKIMIMRNNRLLSLSCAFDAASVRPLLARRPAGTRAWPGCDARKDGQQARASL